MLWKLGLGASIYNHIAGKWKIDVSCDVIRCSFKLGSAVMYPMYRFDINFKSARLWQRVQLSNKYFQFNPDR